MHKLLFFFHFPNPGLATKSSLNLPRFGRFVTYLWKVTCTSGGVGETQEVFRISAGNSPASKKKKTTPSSVLTGEKKNCNGFFLLLSRFSRVSRWGAKGCESSCESYGYVSFGEGIYIQQTHILYKKPHIQKKTTLK